MAQTIDEEGHTLTQPADFILSPLLCVFVLVGLTL
jgi:hypothetical protein